MLAHTGLSATRIAFYATTATVLPIMMIAIAIQLRQTAVPQPAVQLGRRALALVLYAAGGAVVVMSTAEISALLVLLDNTDDSLSRFFVKMGLAIGLALFVVGILNEVIFRILKDTHPVRADKESQTEVSTPSDSPAQPDQR